MVMRIAIVTGYGILDLLSNYVAPAPTSGFGISFGTSFGN